MKGECGDFFGFFLNFLIYFYFYFYFIFFWGEGGGGGVGCEQPYYFEIHGIIIETL